MIRRWAPLLTGGILLAVLGWFYPDLAAKNAAQSADRDVALVTDWEDVVAFHGDLAEPSSETILMSWRVSAEDENAVRRSGRRILWRLDADIEPRRWLSRFQGGDGVFISDEHVLEHPEILRELPDKIDGEDGFLSMMEFIPNKLLPSFARQIPGRLVKSHLLSTREMLTPKRDLWMARLIRAVEERWVRLLVIRYAPTWTLEQNLQFRRDVAEALRKTGFVVAAPEPFQSWPARTGGRFRLIIALFISVAVPCVIFYLARGSTFPVFVCFLIACALSFLAGLTIHALGAFPAVVIGLDAMRGVKLQLVLPLAFAFLLIVPRDRLARFFDMPITVKHVFLVGLFVVVGAGVYLMRSGNFPLIPASDAERGFRNWLDHLLIARPRFKEFMIGHPFFLLGLVLKKRASIPPVWADFILWIGLVGQISILNTFTHFHSPMGLGVIRTFHGIWIGSLMAVPGLLLLDFKK